MSRVEVLLTWNGEDVKKRAQALIGKSTWAIGLAVLSDAKMLCPVDLGYLAASTMAASSDDEQGFESATSFGPGGGKAPSVFRRIKRPGFDPRGKQVFVGTAVEYGPYVEFGTVRSSAQPFLRPALDMARGKVPRIVKSGAKVEFGGYLK